MADIFISYKKEDAGRVIRIVEALRAEGFSVWWDHGITPGAQWDQTIHQELNTAKAVIAIWSETSISAPWVKEEASVGKNRGILLPIRIDAVEPPLGFSLIQMGDLVGWTGDRDDQHWQLVLGALRAIIRGETPQGLEAAPRKRKARWAPWAIAAVIALLALGGGAYLALSTINSVSVTRQAGAEGGAASTSTVTIARGGGAPSTPGGASAQEQAAWDEAMEAKSRQAFQAYLIAYPDGAYTQRARDILLTCRSEQREMWQPQRTGQMIRGVNAEFLPTQAQACAAAHAMARATSERTCRAISANEGYRGGEINFVEGPCDCRQTPAGFMCTADPTYACSFEMRSQQNVEICGG